MENRFNAHDSNERRHSASSSDGEASSPTRSRSSYFSSRIFSNKLVWTFAAIGLCLISVLVQLSQFDRYISRSHRPDEVGVPIRSREGMAYHTSLSLVEVESSHKPADSKIFNPLGSLVDAFWGKEEEVDDGISEDIYRIALVMPCTIQEAVISLSMAMLSAVESQESYDEVTVVFGVTFDLESALLKVFKPDVSPQIDFARDHMRNFLLTWLHDSHDQQNIAKRSIELNTLSPEESMSPQELLETLHLHDWLKDKAKSRLAKATVMEEFSREEIYAMRLFDWYQGYPTMQEIAESLPKFQVVLHRSEFPYANANRQAGSDFSFLDASEPRDNDIIAYVDCDDLVSPARSFMVKQVFKENTDVVEFASGARGMNFEAAEDDDFMDETKAARFTDILQLQPPEVDTSEWREGLFEKYFDFRDPEIKKKYIHRQHTDAFLEDTHGEVIEDPWNIHEHFLSDGVNFSWWLGRSAAARISDFSGGYGIVNGHTAWRHSWLRNSIIRLPNSRRGQDSRLTYMSLALGGNMLGSPVPLTSYLHPSGLRKRRIMDELTEWNRRHYRMDDAGEEVRITATPKRTKSTSPKFQKNEPETRVKKTEEGIITVNLIDSPQAVKDIPNAGPLVRGDAVYEIGEELRATEPEKSVINGTRPSRQMIKELNSEAAVVMEKGDLT